MAQIIPFPIAPKRVVVHTAPNVSRAACFGYLTGKIAVVPAISAPASNPPTET